MPDQRAASNYSGKSGKTNVQMQGHTNSGSYGSDLNMKRRTPAPPSDERP
jgi:hypothetical protein